MADWNKAVDYVLNNEGGYSNRSDDPGGETAYGISKKSHPDLDIKNLTVKQAKEIYYQEYWLLFGINNIINDNIATKLMDMAVNMGGVTAIILAQRTVMAVLDKHLVDDGKLGEKTLTLINREFKAKESFSSFAFLACLKALCAEHYRHLIVQHQKFKVFEAGWMRRAYSLPD